MSEKIIAIETSECRHYGSVFGGGSIVSTFNSSSPDFVRIENKKIMTFNNTINTPSHKYAEDEFGNPLFHSHPNQDVDQRQQSYVTIENIPILLVYDKNITNDTRIIDGDINNFSKIEV